MILSLLKNALKFTRKRLAPNAIEAQPFLNEMSNAPLAKTFGV